MKSVSKIAIALLLSLPLATAQRPNTTTPCDYYAAKSVGANTPENQRLLMALVLHSALLGPFSTYNNVKVPDFVGALQPTVFKGEYVDLNGYFNGGFASANVNGQAAAVNFLDDGGLDATRQLKPSNGNSSSNQDRFFTHVYEYFGTFLGCSSIGSTTLPAYAGRASMYETHKFMDLSAAEMGFFIDQAVRGLLSFGFESPDAQFVNATLNAVFNKRCAPAAAVVPANVTALQAICVAPDCALSPNDTCSAYAPAVPPVVANATLVGNYTKEPNGTTTAVNASTTSQASSARPTVSTAGGSSVSGSGRGAAEVAVAVFGAALLAIAL